MNAKNFAVVLLLALAILAVAPGVLTSAEEAGICEKAVFACLNDPTILPFFGAIFCLEGYAFCKKYIEGQ